MAPEQPLSLLADLPADILVQMFPYLDAKSFLAFCSACRAFREGYLHDATYWRHVTRSTFRVPNQPVVENDGARWQKLYRRMFSQTRVFTWGDATKNRLGHSGRSQDCSFPLEMDDMTNHGVIADMQCGGWSTTFLTAQGTLHTVGVLNGMLIGFHELQLTGPRRLMFPVPDSFREGTHNRLENEHLSTHAQLSSRADVTSQDSHDGCSDENLEHMYDAPVTTIRQFSSGRTHILGLSDSGRIWSWYSVNRPALQIKFADVDIQETVPNGSSWKQASPHGRVKKVVAGWSKSSALIEGVGIVIWEPVQRTGGEEQGIDTVLVLEHQEVASTDQRPGADAVTNYIMLENYVVWTTDTGKVNYTKLEEQEPLSRIVCLEKFTNARESATKIDVQGSFRRFAIFNGGEVLTFHQDDLDTRWENEDDPSTTVLKPQRIPALQQNNVISVAFGDYHFLALHANGKITSYGTECRACGALGLGLPPPPSTTQRRSNRTQNFNIQRLRGVQHTGFDHTASLVPHAYTSGREIWFGREKLQWLAFLAAGGKDREEALERMGMFADTNVQGEVSEWIEQEGRDWDKNLDVQDDDGLGSHFALSICAAGWHSGALVLVNERLAREVKSRCVVQTSEAETQTQGEAGSWNPFPQIRFWLRNFAQAYLGSEEQDNQKDSATYCWSHKSFPRLVLSDGREMPGTVPFDEWKYGRPEWKLDVQV